jgi:hypothetical protein
VRSVSYERLRTSTEPAAGVRKSMRSNRSTGTSPEVKLRKALWAAGLRGYRKNVASLSPTQISPAEITAGC